MTTRMLRTWAGSLGLSLCASICSLASAAPRAAATPFTLRGPIAAPRAHANGDAVFVLWGGSWWKAHAIGTLTAGRVVVHYDGWGDEWDEVATPPRLRTELAGGKAYRAGDAVFIEWKGSWWPGTILRVEAGGEYLIHYDGYGSEWDEKVPSARLTRLSAPEG